MIHEEVILEEIQQQTPDSEGTEEEQSKEDNKLKKILSLISMKYPSSNVFQTGINDISDDKMGDTFHVIKMSESNKRPFDVCKDGFIYKPESSKKAFPSFFEKQNVAYFSCQGLLICVNPDCPLE